MFGRTSPKSKAEIKISAFQQYYSLQTEDIKKLEAELRTIEKKIDQLRSKWSQRGPVLSLQRRVEFSLWTRSKKEMESEIKPLFQKQSELKLQIDRKNQTRINAPDFRSAESPVYQETSMMERLARAGSFKSVSLLSDRTLSTEDEYSQSDQEGYDADDEEMCFAMDSVTLS